MEIRNLDPSTSFVSQLDEAGDEAVTVINTVVAPPGELEACLRAWNAEAAVMTKQPGFVSTQLYRGVGGSNTLINVAMWESASHVKAALARPERSPAQLNPPDGMTVYPTLVRKVAVAGVGDA
jgi:heme-degrading monooxygenase HmoA